MVVSGLLQALASLMSVPKDYEVGFATHLVWALWRRENLLLRSGSEPGLLSCLPRGRVAISTLSLVRQGLFCIHIQGGLLNGGNIVV
jgi:hypothetical protein